MEINTKKLIVFDWKRGDCCEINKLSTGLSTENVDNFV